MATSTPEMYETSMPLDSRNRIVGYSFAYTKSRMVALSRVMNGRL